ncbi:hypothetical protein BCR32DRAFT_246613 [Anaeromyces robustus]|uniref:Uncharacterized protein n=1 Tax=Anaeromyces robustus TaxID=1754192 RepID=A0A1Y1X047_9FUNG|nr:hypothetical protein BCR32DRAFT_246613 [Anaeromyces robustus]|eukprot:ORX79160.1 hypothetical protein BCR32DRAFT_246613 [Anaeromyces robustus]
MFFLIVFFTYIINIQIKYSYGLNNITLYTYENITDCEASPNYIYVYDKSKILNKNEVLKIKNKFNLGYYCKNDICVEVNRDILLPFVEIPDKEDIIYTVSQCLTNKCIEGACIFNKENPSEFCTDIYNYFFIFKYSYMNCGKAIGDICKKNKECASKKCFNNSEYSYCGSVGGPSDKYRNNLFIISLRLGITVFYLYNLYIFMNLN